MLQLHIISKYPLLSSETLHPPHHLLSVMRTHNASSPFLSANLLLILAIVILGSSASQSKGQPYPKHGFKVDLHHVDSNKNLSPWDIIMRGVRRGRHRHAPGCPAPPADLPADNKTLHSPLHAGNGEYYMELAIGTQKTPFSAIMDTGSDLIWTQCQPCTNCFPQSTPVFDPARSSSFANVSCASDFCKEMDDKFCARPNNNCAYSYGYADQSTTRGFVGKDTFTFGNPGKEVSVPNIGFGCGIDNDGRGLNHGTGLVGLGRGHLSLITQLGYNKFAYCLTPTASNKTSKIIFGPLADTNFTHILKETPLISNPSRPSQYHLSLQGITVGDKLLKVEKSLVELGRHGAGGMMLDSGTTISYLTNKTFNDVKSEFVAQMKLEAIKNNFHGLELCFKLPANVRRYHVPKLVFHFKGSDMELRANNYMLADTSRGLLCLTLGSGSVGILGNLQQQNMMVVHDLEKETVSFTPTDCTQI